MLFTCVVSYWYTVCAVVGRNVTLPGLPHLASQSRIVSNAPRTIVISFSVWSAHRVGIFPSLLCPIFTCITAVGLSHLPVLSFPNQNLCLGSICSAMAGLESRASIINTPQHLIGDPNGIDQPEQVRLEEHRMRLRWYNGVPSHEEPHRLYGFINPCQECVGQ